MAPRVSKSVAEGPKRSCISSHGKHGSVEEVSGVLTCSGRWKYSVVSTERVVDGVTAWLLPSGLGVEDAETLSLAVLSTRASRASNRSRILLPCAKLVDYRTDFVTSRSHDSSSGRSDFEDVSFPPDLQLGKVLRLGLEAVGHPLYAYVWRMSERWMPWYLCCRMEVG